MKLELAEFPVKDVQFSKQTGYNNGVLEVDKDELGCGFPERANEDRSCS